MKWCVYMCAHSHTQLHILASDDWSEVYELDLGLSKFAQQAPSFHAFVEPHRWFEATDGCGIVPCTLIVVTVIDAKSTRPVYP